MAYQPAIKLACRNYDGTNAILRGIVTEPGLDLRIVETHDVPDMFSRMYKGEFDVSEMSLAELVYYTSRDQAEFIGIPVFPSRVFRHGFIFLRTSSGIRRAGELSGRKIGFVRWVQTASIWMRGLLIDEYGVSAKDTSWYVASIHHWDAADAEITPRDGSGIKWVESAGKNASEKACRALADGEIDALGITDTQLPWLLADPAAVRLFENFRDVETAYFRKTKILPIMHVLAMRKELADENPDLPAKLFRLFSAAKQWARRWRRAIPSMVEAWPHHYLNEEQKIFQQDPWAYGLEKNKHVLERFLAYCHAAGISDREIAPAELFIENSRQLEERDSTIESKERSHGDIPSEKIG